MPSQPNPARAKESAAHNLNQRAHQYLVITPTYSLELPIIHKNHPKRKQILKLNKKTHQNKNNKNKTHKKLDTIKNLCIINTINKTTKQQNNKTTKQQNNKTTKQQNNKNKMNNSLLDIQPLLNNNVKPKPQKLTEKERLKSAPWKLKLNFSDKSVTFHKTKEKLITYYQNLSILGSADIYKGYLNDCQMLRYRHHSYFKGEG